MNPTESIISDNPEVITSAGQPDTASESGNEAATLADNFKNKVANIDPDKDPNVFENAEGKKFRIETYTSAEITPEVLQQISDFYRLVFAGSFGQYLTYPSEAKPIPPHMVFNISEGTTPDLSELDSYNPETYPVHPQTGEHAIFWHDPTTTVDNFTHKAEKDAHFTIFRDLETNQIAGLMFGNACSLRQAFAQEEWENPLYYSGIRPEGKLRDYDNFERRLNEAYARKNGPVFTPETQVYVWNCIATRPDLRGPEYLTKLTKTFFRQIPEEMKSSLYIVGQANYGTKAHFLFTKVAGALEVRGVLCDKEKLEKNDPVIVTSSLQNGATVFSMSPEELDQTIKAMLKR